MQGKLHNLTGIVVAGCIFLSFLFISGVFSNIQLNLSDGLYGGLSPREDIVIAAIDDKSLQEIGRWPWDREVFADLFYEFSDADVVGVDVAFFESSDKENDEALINSVQDNGNIIVPVEYTSYVVEDEEVFGKDPLVPIEGLGEAAESVGYINIVTDRDGVSRAVNLDVKGEYNSFTSEIYEEYTGEEYEHKEDRYLINFVGRPGSFTTYSISDIFEKDYDFEGKIVLVGATSPDMHDEAFVPTSYGKAMPGVEIHANTLQTMLNNDRLYNEHWFLVVMSIFTFALLSALLAYKLNPWLASGISLLLMVLYLFVSISMFSAGIIMNLVYVPLSFVFGNFSAIVFFYITEKKEKKQIRAAFSRYVAPDVVKDMIKNPSKLKLGGDRREITLLFSDIRGFTTLSESMGPEELVHLLNEYLSEMTDIVMDHKGLVDKFIGDAVMAFWGAPIKDKDHAVHACQTALVMKERLVELNERWMKEGRPELKIGIGLNSGEAVVGNMGSEQRFDYTAMGDNVNLASRLEGVTKQYGVDIIVSESVKEKVSGFVFRELDVIAVKGKKKGIKIFELLGKKMSDEQKFLKENYEKGLENYKKKEWDSAIAYFEKIADIDYSAKLFIDRCKTYKKEDPGSDWDGVWRLTSK